MWKATIAGAAFLAWTLPPASASGPVIDHSGVGCVVAERLVMIEAGVRPPDEVARVRLFFRASGTRPWYSVEMKGEGRSLLGLLPRPRRDIERLEYYIEAIDRGLQVVKTDEFSPRVVPRAEGCDPDVIMAATAAAGTVEVAAPAGAPAVPAGFSPSGVVGLGAAAAAGGAAAGISATAIAIGAAGAAAAVAAVAVAGGGNEAAASTPAPAATSAPTPAPASPSPSPDSVFSRYYGAYTVTYRRHESSAVGCFDERTLGTLVTTLSGDAGGAFFFQQSPSSARWPGTIQPDGGFQAAQSDGVVMVEGRTDGTRISGTTRTQFCRSDFEGAR